MDLLTTQHVSTLRVSTQLAATIIYEISICNEVVVIVRSIGSVNVNGPIFILTTEEQVYGD
jgi:hypothetical protein